MAELAASAEEMRLAALHALHQLDTEASRELDSITALCKEIFGVDSAYISLIDRDHQWIKSTTNTHIQGVPRQQSFCTHTIAQAEVLVVEDARDDPRFRDNAMVSGPAGVRFYAGAPLLTADGHAVGALCLIDSTPRSLDVLQRRQLEQLAVLAMSQMTLRRTAGRVDLLTGLPNKYQLLEDLGDIGRRASQCQRVLVYLDMPDASKAFDIASVLGIAFYDDLVRNVGQRLQQLVKGKADVYHITDARFALLSRETDAAVFEDFLHGLEPALAQPVESMSLPLSLPSYGGIVVIEPNPEAMADAPRKALAAVHQALERAQRWVSYDAQEDSRHRRSFRLLNDITGALVAPGFQLAYQPKLDLASDRYHSAEVLLRWQHPQLGAISPAEFIPLVERTTLIQQVSDWVMRAALRQMGQWRQDDMHLKLAINLSARNFEEDDLCHRLSGICAEAGIDPRMVEIECTEGLWMQSPKALRAMHEIRALGMGLALDDFGTGYSNFAYLQQVPATVVKLDQSLICNLDTSARDRRIVQSLIALAKELDYRIVAEGVETAETLQLIRDWGCDEAQGYHLSRPLTSSALVQHLKNAA